ncbi:hypothetical protein [Herbaspirillum huttiense]|uniref:hypothetical protein n=1 Tax=Herbaspirillum huttiense TaxID=863372 RepID=UPI0012FF0C3E|nr:hypothetical protein [Herbaspirillum huttiense]
MIDITYGIDSMWKGASHIGYLCVSTEDRFLHTALGVFLGCINEHSENIDLVLSSALRGGFDHRATPQWSAISYWLTLEVSVRWMRAEALRKAACMKVLSSFVSFSSMQRPLPMSHPKIRERFLLRSSYVRFIGSHQETFEKLASRDGCHWIALSAAVSGVTWQRR